MVSRTPNQVPEIAPLESLNWLIHHLYTQWNFEKCKSFINIALCQSGMPLEYPMYCLGLIQMKEGNAQDALTQFLACVHLNPSSVTYKKQSARCLLLLGQHNEALSYYHEAIKTTQQDWELYLDQGLCYQFKADHALAEEYFLEAVKHTTESMPFEKLAEMRTARGDIDGAIEILKQALSHRSDQPDLLARLGMLYLKKGEENHAFEQIGTALSYKPNHFQAILAATTVMITHGDYDVAMSKYRVALRDAPENPTLWNNMGVAYFGKKKWLSSMLCLRRAAYLNPSSWIIAANRGVLYLHTNQYSSAVQMLQTSIQLRQCRDSTVKGSQLEQLSRKGRRSIVNHGEYSEGMLHGLLALAFSGLDNHVRAQPAHVLACKLDCTNPVLALNFSIALLRENREEAVKALYECQKRMIKYGTPQTNFDGSEISDAVDKLRRKLIPDEPRDQQEQSSRSDDKSSARPTEVTQH